MSPSTFARTTSATLMCVGALAIVAAAAIGMTGWPPATAHAETLLPVSTEGASLTLTAEASLSATASAEGTHALLTSTVAAPSKQKSVKKAPVPKKKVAKKKKRPKIRWSTAKVSWYGPGFYGNTMAGGGKLHRTSMVVAHRSLPFGTRVQFSYRGRTVTAVVKDRGPYISGRTFDLGPGTAKKLRFSGVGKVKYRILKRRR